MSTLTQAHALIDQYTAAQLAGERIIYGNIDDATYSQGTAPYISQDVVYSVAAQCGLGDSQAKRNRGYVVFVIYEPKGKGRAGRNSLLDKVVNSFASRSIGDVTMLGARIVNRGQTKQWAITGVQIPFHTDTH